MLNVLYSSLGAVVNDLPKSVNNPEESIPPSAPVVSITTTISITPVSRDSTNDGDVAVWNEKNSRVKGTGPHSSWVSELFAASCQRSSPVTRPDLLSPFDARGKMREALEPQVPAPRTCQVAGANRGPGIARWRLVELGPGRNLSS